MLNCLCADRLNPWWYYCCTSHACAFSCIHTLHSIYFCIFELFGAFLIISFFPLPLSLSLVYVSASMAPKHKSALSRNPLHSWASSSSILPPFLFGSMMRMPERTSWRNFLKKNVHSEHRVILADFVDIDLPDVIHSQGWESLCDVPVTYPSVLIQEFYSNNEIGRASCRERV